MLRYTAGRGDRIKQSHFRAFSVVREKSRKVRGVARCFWGQCAEDDPQREGERFGGQLSRCLVVSLSRHPAASESVWVGKNLPAKRGRGGAFSGCLPLATPRLVSRIRQETVANQRL